MSENFFLQHLRDVPVIAILRGHAPAVTVDLAVRCWDAGIELVEVPSQGPEGVAALEATAVAAESGGHLVGAGTICSPTDARIARESGAQFLVSPGLDADTVDIAREWAMPYLPGVATPGEVQSALAHGVDVLKLFPAGPLGSDWIKALHGPFPQARLVAVGGVTATSAAEFLQAGAVGVGLGSGLSAQSIADLASLNTART